MPTDLPLRPPARRVPLLYYLLAVVPVAIVLHLLHAPGLWVFLAAAVAIVPLAGLMGRSTEHLAHRLGPGVGGLLNATFGNAAELILALMALAGGKGDLVKASITGSVIGNVLLVLGLAILLGGFYHPRQTFNRTAASLGGTLLALACVGLIVPAVFYHMVPAGRREALEHVISREIAVILVLMYLLSLVFSLWTHRRLFAGPEMEHQQVQEAAGWSIRTATLVLVGATAVVALMSELLVGSVEEAAHALGMSDLFIGVIVVAVIGNAAEHSTAVLAAIENKMDLAFTIAVGSSFQVALFVAPVLLGASYLLGPQPIDLHFSVLEVVAVVLAIGILSMVTQDGESHWMEGALLLAVYLILALAFYHAPADLMAAGGG
jgi:Ca2+:H+ antiporter